MIRLLSRAPRSWALALGLAAFVLLAGAGLLAVSGWFVTAAAAAGMAGAGLAFDVFAPSALIRFLALSRAAGRYGERLAGHDATLRAVEGLRSDLLGAELAAPLDRGLRRRSAEVLNLVLSDVAALEAASLRLVLPLIAGVLTLAVAGVLLAWAFGALLAVWIAGGWAVTGALVLVLGGRAGVHASAPMAEAGHDLRRGLVDLVSARDDLAVHGALGEETDRLLRAESARHALRLRTAATERRASIALSVAQAILGGGSLSFALSQALSPPMVLAALLVTLALGEALMPFRRMVAEMGRTQQASRRLHLPAPETPPTLNRAAEGLHLHDLTLPHPGGRGVIFSGLTLSLHPGETLAVTGPSGCGKSSLLWALAGLAPFDGVAEIGGLRLPAPEDALRTAVTLVPQRSVLIAGTVAENLRLAAPGAEDAALHHVLDLVELTEIFNVREGLATRIGPRAEGISGGEARRLALARAILRRPEVLLLDEPTEGIDEARAARILSRIRQVLPRAVIVLAAHRPLEKAFAERYLPLG